MKKQLLLFILALLPMLAMADDSGSCGTNVTWTYNSTTKTLTIQGSGAMEDYYDTMSIPWYSYRTNINTVIIGEGVTHIGDYAFNDYSELSSVTIPNSVTSIGSEAFECQNMPNFYLSVYITDLKLWCDMSSGYIGRAYCLYLNNNLLTELNIPEGVTSIRGSAFTNCCEIESITIPEGVTSIGPYAFSVNLPGQGERILTSVTIPSSLVSIGYDAFSGEWAYNNAIKISDLAAWCNILDNNSGLHNIHSRLFLNGEEILDLEIPQSVTSINPNTFSNFDRIATLAIPNSVTSIGSDAFRKCSGLTSVTIPNSVTSIGGSAFEGCSGLTSVTIGNGVTSIGQYAFRNCSGLASITVAQGNAKYDSRDNCYAIIETASNTLIAGCKTTIIPNSVTSIGYSAFSGCSGLTSITLPNSVTSIGEKAFSGCSGLTSVTIPNSVTSLGSDAFNGCSGLTSVTIGNSVTSIGSYAFYGCSNLTSVKSKIETPFAFGSSAFYYVSGTCVLTVPKGTRDAYIAAGWTESVFRGGVVENDNVAIAMETGSGAPRTMIGYSSQYNLDFTGINDVKAYLAIGFTDTKSVLMARVYVVPANTGIVLKSDVAGVEVEVPTTTSDVYYANLLKPAVDNVTIYPTEDIDAVNYTNLMVGKLDNEQMGFVTLPSSKAYSNKCYLQIPTAFYESATSAREGGMEIVFVDDETTDIRSLMHNGSATNDAYYDLQGRKVIPGKKGIYIHNGKKVIVR